MPVKTKISKKPIKKEPSVQTEAVLMEDNNKEAVVLPKTEKTKRGCFFCQNNKEPQYSDSASLRKFISDRSRILPKMRTGNCSKHQRYLTKQIKYARHLALLPFVPSI